MEKIRDIDWKLIVLAIISLVFTVTIGIYFLSGLGTNYTVQTGSPISESSEGFDVVKYDNLSSETQSVVSLSFSQDKGIIHSTQDGFQQSDMDRLENTDFIYFSGEYYPVSINSQSSHYSGVGPLIIVPILLVTIISTVLIILAFRK